MYYSREQNESKCVISVFLFLPQFGKVLHRWHCSAEDSGPDAPPQSCGACSGQPPPSGLPLPVLPAQERTVEFRRYSFGCWSIELIDRFPVYNHSCSEEGKDAKQPIKLAHFLNDSGFPQSEVAEGFSAVRANRNVCIQDFYIIYYIRIMHEEDKCMWKTKIGWYGKVCFDSSMILCG